MDHSEIVNVLLKVHGSVLLTSIAAFYMYSDRTDGFAASLKGTTEVLTELRRRIARTLEERLRPIFESPGAVPSPVLLPNGGTYVEHAVNPVGSEIYRECIRDFLDAGIDWISDYHALSHARKGWSFWTTALRNVLLAIFCWQLVQCAILFFDSVSDKFTLPDWSLCVMTAVTGAGIASVVTSIAFRLVHYRTTTEMRLKYAEL